jgi:hypothetical protein
MEMAQTLIVVTATTMWSGRQERLGIIHWRANLRQRVLRHLVRVGLLESMPRRRNFNCTLTCVNRSGLRRREPLGSGLNLSARGGRVDAVLGLPFGKGLALEHEFFAEARIKIAE